ncbi:MAG: Arm DNA-binding domain-containing protein [Gammaproteobacteria bacterium]|nr:Arm DNA-binding domain-containing protein [Gammaproteobacteria bacterium]
MGLTDAACRAKWDGKDRMMGDGGGLYLNVRRKSKTWIVRRTRAGAKRVMTLGHHPDMSLAEARREAAKLDPRKHGSTRTVSDLVKDYRGIIERDNKRPHLTTGYLDRGIPLHLRDMRIADVARADLVAAIREYKIRINGRSGERARDAFRGILRQMFGLAVEQGDIDINPAAGITARITGYTPKDRARVLNDDEIRLLWRQV